MMTNALQLRDSSEVSSGRALKWIGSLNHCCWVTLLPGIFLVRQADRRYLVLDGQQRLRTLQLFYNGEVAGREFSLNNVTDQLKGLTYKSLPEDERRQLDNTFFQATVVDTDGTRESLDVVYQIFERLNSGGTQLTPHEIRVALYAGPFIDFLERLNQDPNWRTVYGRQSPRLRDQNSFYEFSRSTLWGRPIEGLLRPSSTILLQNIVTYSASTMRILRPHSGAERTDSLCGGPFGGPLLEQPS